MRVLNRPAKPGELKAVLEDLKGIQSDHDVIAAALQRREAEWKELEPKLQKEREESIAKTKAELEAWQKEIAPRIAEEEKRRQENIAAKEKDVKDYEAKMPEVIAAWEKKQKKGGYWVPLVPVKLDASQGAKLVVQPDLSIIATEKNGKGNYVLTLPTDLKGITSIRLEALEDGRLPTKGPGRAPDGNFVLVQFEVQAAPKAEPAKLAKVTLQNARADFSQLNFEVAKAINGTPDNGTGWAVSPSTGVTHWATFETKEPLGYDGGTLLTITMKHSFNSPDFMLARFRISVTTTPGVGLGLSDELRAILSTEADKRTDDQKNALAKYYNKVDGELVKKNAAVAEAKKPLPIDPHLKEIQDSLAQVSKPVPLDVTLVQLRNDSAQSTKQVADARLTAAQDLAWALINSPAFLFNR